jgi:predicted TIM-barrel fold metal-dependent hydrolase
MTTAAAKNAILGVVPTPSAFEVPRGACDCHTHIFGPVETFPFSRKRLYTPGDTSIDDLNALHRTLHIDRVVIVHPSPYGADNSCTVDTVRRLGPRARGVAVIDDSTSARDLADMHAAGVRGVRVNLESYGESDPAVAGRHLQNAAARVAPLGWHVQTYTNLAVLAALRDTILALPTTLVVDHFGRPQAALGTAQPGFEPLLALLRSGKVYVKISAPYRISVEPHYPDAAPIARHDRRQSGPHRVGNRLATSRRRQTRSSRDRAVPAGRQRRGAQPAGRMGQKSHGATENPRR